MFKTERELLKDKQAHILTELRVLRLCTEQNLEVKQRIENLRLEYLYVREDIKEQESCLWNSYSVHPLRMGLASEPGKPSDARKKAVYGKEMDKTNVKEDLIRFFSRTLTSGVSRGF